MSKASKSTKDVMMQSCQPKYTYQYYMDGKLISICLRPKKITKVPVIAREPVRDNRIIQQKIEEQHLLLAEKTRKIRDVFESMQDSPNIRKYRLELYKLQNQFREHQALMLKLQSTRI